MRYNQLTTEQFIKKAILIHGYKYNYSKVIYVNNWTKVIIICPIHGEFEQTPANHLFGKKCKKCAKEIFILNHPNRLTQEEFIRKCILIHGNRFDYSKVIYIDSKTKIIIICPDHGEFGQTPADHLSGCGCTKCKYEKIIKLHSYTKEEFIYKAKEVHGDKYDYRFTEFLKTNNKGKIKCNTCDHIFEQRINAHLQGQGCPKCSAIKVGSYSKSNTEEFIQKARDVHGNSNDYSKFIYISSCTKGCVTCLIENHGDFWVTPNNHLSKKSNCPKCNASKGELALEEIFKKHNIEAKPQYNIPEIVANYEVDFYLPEYRLLVEFHGIQHYEYIPFFHDNDYSFDDQKRRDDMVRDAAIRWKYNYLEFNYKQFKYMTKEQFEEMVINKIKHIRCLH